MGIQGDIIADKKLPRHNHSQRRLNRLETQLPDVTLSVLRFCGVEAASHILRYDIAFSKE